MPYPGPNDPTAGIVVRLAALYARSGIRTSENSYSTHLGE
jgi:hypothetical protein